MAGGEGYRFGYNGQEYDQELDLLVFKYRNANPKTCRFGNVDPIAGKYPELTPYQISSNNPIWMVELEGLEGKPGNSMFENPNSGMDIGQEKANIAEEKANSINISLRYFGDYFSTPKDSEGSFRASFEIENPKNANYDNINFIQTVSVPPIDDYQSQHGWSMEKATQAMFLDVYYDPKNGYTSKSGLFKNVLQYEDEKGVAMQGFVDAGHNSPLMKLKGAKPTWENLPYYRAQTKFSQF